MKKNILIIGGARGVGLHLSELLLADNNNIIIIGRDKRKSNNLENGLRKKYNSNKVFVRYININQKYNYRIIKNLIKLNFNNTLDHMISFIGTGKTSGIFDKSIKAWKADFDINFFSNVNAVNHFYKFIERSNINGSIILTSALAGSTRLQAPISYSTAKSALITYINHMGSLLASHGVRIFSVSPGNIFYKGGRWEEIMLKDKSIKKKYIEKEVPLKRFGTAEEIAYVYYSLLNEKNSFMTGNNIILDGGQSRTII